MDQSARTAALESFRNGEVTLLIASDVAARGLDIPAVSHIFNFDVPHHPDDYVHRIGRTGRAGLSGTAITLVAPIDGKAVAAIEKLIGQTIPWAGAGRPAERRRTARRAEHGGHRRAAPAATAHRRPPPQPATAEPQGRSQPPAPAPSPARAPARAGRGQRRKPPAGLPAAPGPDSKPEA